MDDIREVMIKRFTTIQKAEEILDSNLTPIQAFYKNSKVLITGGTGFLGLILLEKLLRSCPVSKIYLLIRNKKGKDVPTRLNDIFSCEIFQSINKDLPDLKKKVVGIEGDCSVPDLGLRLEDRQLLIDEVDIVFHAAATVRFDEKLKKAVHINIRGTKDLLRIIRQMPKLKSFMYVSTAFCNCSHTVIEEEFYPPVANYEGLISMSETLSDDILDSITPQLMETFPNTYVFTKQVCEDVVRKECQGLPAGVHRPSIVVSTYKEPITGWINNIYGPTGAILGSGLGILRVLHCNSEAVANLVPVDMCVNSLIAGAWEVGKNFEEAKKGNTTYKIPVYVFESKNDQPITWDYFSKTCFKYGDYCRSAKSIWWSCMYLQKHYPLYIVMVFLLHTLPSLLADVALWCAGKKQRMFEIYKKIHKFSGVISFFCTKDITMKSENVRKLIGKMSDGDRRLFFCDVKELDWDKYLQTYMIGCRVYIAKDPLDTLAEGAKKAKRFYWAHQTIKAILMVGFLWILRSILSLVFKLL